MIQPVKNRMTSAWDDLPKAPMEAINQAVETTQTAIEDNPGIAVMTAFAVGVGVGVGLAALLCIPSSSSARTGGTWF
jgi:ElaB/YqjD/DUF883 family membrane-anchored ribosome-binding protein